MEPKKIKKLEIKKEVIANLDDSAMSRLKGGTDDWFPTGGTVCVSCNTAICPNESVYCPLKTIGYGCPDTAIGPGGDCATYDMEICRYSDYHCNTDYWC